MELVNINLFAEGYYSESTYEDNIWIKKSSYEKLMEVFPKEISCGELDGKYSEVMGEVEVKDYSYTDEYYAKMRIQSMMEIILNGHYVICMNQMDLIG